MAPPARWSGSTSIDTGIGVPEDEQERIFEKFHRIAGPEYPGTGLGLSIARELVVRHGGTLTLESTVGLGSRFSVLLPAGSDARQLTVAERPLVLVVDDMVETRRLMRRVLERGGFRVIEAGTGEEALRSINSSRPALVVLDLRLPGISGFDVARAVRADPDLAVAATVLLACSASVQAEVRREALDAGCDDFEGKPFDVRAFAERVRELIAQPGRS